MAVNGLTLKARSYIIWIFHPLEAVSRYRDPQLQLGKKYSYLYILKQYTCQSSKYNVPFFYTDTFPANTRLLANADLMLVQRRRRWTNIKAALAKRFVFAGLYTGSRVHHVSGRAAVRPCFVFGRYLGNR